MKFCRDSAFFFHAPLVGFCDWRFGLAVERETLHERSRVRIFFGKEKAV